MMHATKGWVFLDIPVLRLGLVRAIAAGRSGGSGPTPGVKRSVRAESRARSTREADP